MYFDNKMTSIYHSKVETLDYFVCLTSLENKQPKQTNNTQAKAKHKQKTKTKNKQTNKQTYKHAEKPSSNNMNGILLENALKNKI